MYRHSGFSAYNVLFVLVSISVVIQAKGPLCLKCDRVRQPYDCTNVIRCGEHELCSVRKYITADGHVLFDVDCSDSQRCQVSPDIIGRREITENKPCNNKRTNSGETTQCKHCCKGDMCNSGTVCGANKFEHNGNLICFKCQSELGSDTCNTVTKCGRDQVCYLESGRSGLSNEIIWTSGCKSKTECTNQTANQAGLCSECCTSDLCNLKCSVRTQVVNHCSPNPCVHGTCHNSVSGYTCKCSTGYTGRTCYTGCPGGWIYYNRACYYFGTSAMPWSHAKDFCIRNGSHLARIESSSEEIFLRRNCQLRSHYGHGYWIDGSDIHSEGSWHWSTGSRISGYTNWNPGEPSNKYDDEDCLELRQRTGWRWNDDTCSTNHLFICEK